MSPSSATAPSHFRLYQQVESDITLLGEALAFAVQPGDLITLSGQLGAGKTTLARALIRSLMRAHNPSADAETFEVPSPTFTLAQPYNDLRVAITHFDLYRLGEAEELYELGLDLALETGAAVVEWPEQADGVLPPATFAIRLIDTDAGETRAVEIVSSDAAADRLTRFSAMWSVLLDAGIRGATHAMTSLTGDASARRYARLSPRATDQGVGPSLVMDWPAQPDGPVIRDGLPYSKIAHIAEDCRWFLGVGEALRDAGACVPKILSADVDHGFLVLEDFGDRVFGHLVAAGEDQGTFWQHGVDVLLGLRDVTPPRQLVSPDMAGSVDLPAYDQRAFEMETALWLDWYWPHVTGSDAPKDLRVSFSAVWSPYFDVLAGTPDGWVLRDYHSPNLIDRPGQDGPARVGLIDFQDAVRGPLAYDLVSLLQDARLDVPPDLEARLLTHYCAQAALKDPDFDVSDFRFVYALCGAQRATKILGIFARLAMRDGKPGYLKHMPRMWTYLDRNLAHPKLAALRTVYDSAFPQRTRGALHPQP